MKKESSGPEGGFRDRIRGRGAELYKFVHDDSEGSAEEFTHYGVGKLIGKYVIREVLGRGGAGIVYKAYDETLKRYVALKILSFVSLSTREYFKREAETLASLRHPNIVPVFEIGEHKGDLYIAMQYVEGKPLSELLGKIDYREAVRVMIEVCKAVSYAHSTGVVHRDIKPHNIIVAPDRSVFVLDFGLAEHIDMAPSENRELVGTPEYMSPEQVKGGEVGSKTDIYSIGITIFQCVTGKLPFTGSSHAEVLEKVVNDEPEIKEGLKPAIRKVIKKCIEKSPSLRYESAEELQKELEDICKTAPQSYKLRILSKKYLVAGIILVCFIVAAYYYWASGFLDSRIYSKVFYEHGKLLLDRIETGIDSRTRSDLKRISSEALSQFTAAIKRDSSNAAAYFARGMVYYRKNDFSSAIDDFTGALKLNPEHYKAIFMRIYNNVLMIASRYDRVLIERKVVGQLNDDLELLKSSSSPKSYIKCAKVVVRIIEHGEVMTPRDIEKMMLLLDSAIEEDSTNEVAYSYRGLLLLTLSGYSDDDKERVRLVKLAREDIRNAIQFDPNRPLYYQSMINICRALGQYDEALRYVGILREIDLENPHFILNEAQIHYYFGKNGRARTALEASLATETKKGWIKLYGPRYYLERAELYLLLGDEPAAERDFNRALEEADSNSRGFIAKEITRIRR